MGGGRGAGGGGGAASPGEASDTAGSEGCDAVSLVHLMEARRAAEDAAEAKIKSLEAQHAEHAAALGRTVVSVSVARNAGVAVGGGGCSGFQYSFSFDDTVNGDDSTFERDGVRVVIDEISLELVNNAELDYVQDLMGAYFSVSNPNATASCGCGTSFSV